MLVSSRSLADEQSCAALQDVSGGKPVLVQGVDLPLWGMEIDPEKAKDEFRSFAARNDGQAGALLALLAPFSNCWPPFPMLLRYIRAISCCFSATLGPRVPMSLSHKIGCA